MRSLYAITLALFVLGATTSAQADTLNMPSGIEQPGIEMPQRGMSMDQVRAQLGAPQEIKTAVGQPPITRWIYDSYTVYFEYRHVINSVPHRR